MQAFSDCLDMKGVLGPYVPFDKKLIFELVTRIRTRDYTVYELIWWGLFSLHVFQTNQHSYQIIFYNIYSLKISATITWNYAG